MSTDRAALIAAILETPDDDAPRLVCADWFEEQGDEVNTARAQFIRTQIERARLPIDDPRQSELAARELRLLKQFGPAWCGSHFAFRKVRFRRGFIEYVHLHMQHFQHHRRQLLALEPVRDISMTGWFRAPVDLLRQVAACEEWQHIETLRVHRQGPHKEPRSSLIELLESPHLTRLRTLKMPNVAFDDDARRRFERLPLLRQLREFVFPTLDTLMQRPGEWFSGGGEAHARRWDELRSLSLPYYLTDEFLRRIVDLPWWNHLTELSLHLPYGGTGLLSTLQGRLPSRLEAFRLESSSTVHSNEFTVAAPLFDRLAQRPLKFLHLAGLPINADMLRTLLKEASRWRLRELSLRGCYLSLDQARAIVAAGGLNELQSLDLSFNRQLDGEAMHALLAGGCLTSVTDLKLAGTGIGNAGIRAFADAPGLGRLHSLDLSGTPCDGDSLMTLLASPNLEHLNWLALGDSAYRQDPTLDFNKELASRVTRLPHLAALRLNVSQIDASVTQHLTHSGSLAWPWIECHTDHEESNYRANRAPDRWPPLDEAMEQHAAWT